MIVLQCIIAVLSDMTLSTLQVQEEIKYQSRRLNQYTCMAVWGGNNELEPALGWFPESKENPLLYAVDFAEIFVVTIRPVLTSWGEDKPGSIPFVDSSPSNGIVSEEPYVKRYAAILHHAQHRSEWLTRCLSRFHHSLNHLTVRSKVKMLLYLHAGLMFFTGMTANSNSSARGL